MVNNGVAKYYQVMFKKPRQEIFVGYDDRFKIGDYVKGKCIILIVCVLKMKKFLFFFLFKHEFFDFIFYSPFFFFYLILTPSFNLNFKFSRVFFLFNLIVEADRGEDLGRLVAIWTAEKFNNWLKNNGNNDRSLSKFHKRMLRLANQDELDMMPQKTDDEDMSLEHCREKAIVRDVMILNHFTIFVYF